MSKTWTPPVEPEGLGSLPSPEPLTVRPGAIKTRVPVGSSKSNARSPTQNSPAWAPKGVIVTFCARAIDAPRPIVKATNKVANHPIFIKCPPSSCCCSAKPLASRGSYRANLGQLSIAGRPKGSPRKLNGPVFELDRDRSLCFDFYRRAGLKADLTLANKFKGSILGRLQLNGACQTLLGPKRRPSLPAPSTKPC